MFYDSIEEKDIQEQVMVQFEVDENGLVSKVVAIDGHFALRAEAIWVIKKSYCWMPAIQNGRDVRPFTKQPITFKLEEEPTIKICFLTFLPNFILGGVHIPILPILRTITFNNIFIIWMVIVTK